MLEQIRQRKEWMFFAALPKADGRLALAWWAVLLLRGVLPARFAIAMDVLVAAGQSGGALGAPLTAIGIVERPRIGELPPSGQPHGGRAATGAAGACH